MKYTSYKLLIPFLIVFAITGCENDIEKINFLDPGENYPDIRGEDIEVIYSDSGLVKVRMITQELKQFNNAEEPYVEFPQGLHVYFYDDSLNVESEISANYAKYYDTEKLWHATGNVKAKNHKSGEQLDTEELFWDEENKKIYSESYTRIVNESGTFYGQNGFKSNQSMTDYELIGSKGVVKIKEDE